jgi:hypothetical protein
MWMWKIWIIGLGKLVIFIGSVSACMRMYVQWISISKFKTKTEKHKKRTGGGDLGALD